MKQLNDSVCLHMYMRVCASVPSRLLTLASLWARVAAFQKEERYLIILCSPTQVIQMIWTLSIGADGHYRAYICNLLPFKCILEKRQSRLLNIHPGGQTATVMNTTLSENYSVLYPAVVEDEKGSGRHVDRHTHAHTHTTTESEQRRRAEESKHAFQDPINL